MADRIGLAQAIELVRQELDEAMRKGKGARIQFNVGPVDLEFQVELGREGGVGGKIRFWIVEVGGDGKITSTSTQVVKVHLEPVDSVRKTQLAVAESEPARRGNDTQPPRGAPHSKPTGA